MNNQDLLKVQGIMRKGYGIIPKVPMQDKRLTPEAKGLYAYFRSYAGAGTTAFPGRNKIIDDMQMSKHRYYKHLNILVQYGYLHIEQATDNKGRFLRNIYTLLEVVEEGTEPQEPKKKRKPPPCPSFSDTDPCPDFEYTEPCPNSPYTANRDTNNNSNIKINNSKSNIYSLSHSPSQVLKVTTKKLDEDEDVTLSHQIKNGTIKKPMGKITLDQKASAKPKYSIQDYQAYKRLIHDNIDYDYLAANNPYDTDFLTAIVEIMLDTILTEEPKQVNIGKETKLREVVKSVFMKLNSDHLELVIAKFKEQSHKINNKTAYLRTMLYNSYLELEAHYTNQVKVDFARKASEDYN